MKYIDLFSGCGGLSLGMESVGAELSFAVEKSEMAARTFAANLTNSFQSESLDITSESEWPKFLARSWTDQIASSRVAVTELSNVTVDPDFLTDYRSENTHSLDAIVGGPPCQGFSLAGRRQPDDIRNQLPWEFLDVVDALHPKIVVIENVTGMANSFGPDKESTFVELQKALANPEVRPYSSHFSFAGLGARYRVRGVLANALHYGAPQHRPRLLIIGVREDVALSSGLEVSVVKDIWKSDFRPSFVDSLPLDVPWPREDLVSGRNLGWAISDLEDHFNDGAFRPNEYSRILSETFGHVCPSRIRSDDIPNHSRRNHRPRTQQRFSLYRLLSDSGVSSSSISKVARQESETEQRNLALKAIVNKLPRSYDDGLISYRNTHEAVNLVLSLLTRKHSQRALKWDEPSRTIVTLPDDYVHPRRSRTFTVRELARLQGFPDEFTFKGHETTGAHRRKLETPQYTQVGNAISPWLGRAIGLMIRRLTSNTHFDA